VLDEKEQLIETWRINNRITLYLLEALTEEQLKVPLAKGKSVESQLSHIHNVRLMWLKVAAPDLWEGLEKLESSGLTKASLAAALESSGEAVAELVGRSCDAGGKVKNFKPNVTAFVAYLAAHDGNHRGQVEVALRQAGTPLSDKIGYGIWEWGTR